jgi:hypothetical protein
MFSRVGITLQAQARCVPRRNPAPARNSTLAREPTPLDAPQANLEALPCAIAPAVDERRAATTAGEPGNDEVEAAAVER